jgi:hypothetical protein
MPMPGQLQALLTYIRTHYEPELHDLTERTILGEAISAPLAASDIAGYINQKEQPSFHKLLFQIIDSRGLRDSYVYKKAGIDRRHFSKIRSNPHYQPSKPTVIAFCFALELSFLEALNLLESCGFSLSRSDRFDLAIRFFLETGLYDLDTINRLLDGAGIPSFIGV